jgi:ABC-type phosphate/phosphonate transport system substrate-binding protein
MSDFFAALPMYDWPEIRAAVDAEWALIRRRLLAAGIEAPEHLVRRNADMPPVPGGIRNASGFIIAPDPATLPPDELDLPSLWQHPRLLFGQACWGPIELGLVSNMRVVGQPDYSAFEGGAGELYSSAIVMRRTGLAEGDVAAPAKGNAAIPLDLLRGRRLAYNSQDSMSGVLALARDLSLVGAGLDIFPQQIETGAHRASVVAVAEGRADVAAIDCRSWSIIQRFEPRARDVAVVGWTRRRKGLPYIAAQGSPVTELPG